MNNLLGKAKLFVNRNASTILTVAGGVGVVATTVMAVTATPKAVAKVQKAEEEKGEKLTKLEIVKETATIYIPTVLVGTSTIACIFGANVLNKRQQAGLMSAYALLDRSYKDYRAKVEELYGDGAHDNITKEIAKDRYEETDISVADDKELFYDEYTGQYYESTIEQVRNAEYLLNRELQLIGAVTAAFYYDCLGVEYDDGGVLGWSVDGNTEYYWQTWIDFSHIKTVMDDGLECTIVRMWAEPYPDFEDIYNPVLG